MTNNEKCLLLILDGWGTAKEDEMKGSAIDNAGPLYFYELKNKYPHASLVTFGEEVGLPQDQMGNSEVGHLNIGAGRIVYQELQRINVAITSGELKNLPELHRTFQYCLENNKKLHLIGLYSDGGVHSHTNHFKAVIEYAEEKKLSDVLIHAFTDGRDCDPRSGKGLLENLEEFLSSRKTKLASICGRYYAMDRDKRWERIKLAYDLLVHGQGEYTTNVIETLENRYSAGETDEFMKPIKTQHFQAIEEGDAVICINFRTDRCREITQVLTQKAFEEFGMKPLNLHYTTMTQYSKDFEKINVLFQNDNLVNTLGEILEKNNRTQLRMAETEKYPHVTFFFSGGREQAFTGENRILVPSPKVATYDLQPEMSAFEIKDKLLVELKNTQLDFIVVNFANTDMVGHTGDYNAVIKAVETVDACAQRVVETGIEKGYSFIIIADHGNSDFMLNADGSPNTAHTTNPVPCILIDSDYKNVKPGKLADIAPTILKIMGIDIPNEMNGDVLV